MLKEEEETHLEEERNMMILDSGTTKTVAGSKWMTDYLQTRDQEELKSISRTTDSSDLVTVSDILPPKK